jgi:hypothetical protein
MVPNATPDSKERFACKHDVLSNATLTHQTFTTNRPDPLRGTIIDGTYDLTVWTDYTGPGGRTAPPSCGPAFAAMAVSNGQARVVDHCCGMQQRYDMTLQIFGTSLAVTNTCPTMFAGGGYPYTATATQIVTFNGSTFTETWTRR